MGELEQIKDTLEERGIVKLEGVVPVDQARAAHRMVLKLAEEHGLYSSGTWMKSSGRFEVPKAFRKALIKLNKSTDFPDLAAAQFHPLIEHLLSAPVTAMAPGQQLLFSLPGREDWSIPSDVWHTDLPRFAERSASGLQSFTFLDDVEPKGGATLIVAGSHRLLRGFSTLPSKEVKAHLQAEDFFKHLFDSERPAIGDVSDAFGAAEGVDLEVVELTGRVGDAYLMDLRVLHTPAPNASETARMMATCRFPRADIAERIAI